MVKNDADANNDGGVAVGTGLVGVVGRGHGNFVFTTISPMSDKSRKSSGGSTTLSVAATGKRKSDAADRDDIDVGQSAKKPKKADVSKPLSKGVLKKRLLDSLT